MLDYRIGKLEAHGIVHGDWLDCGCAEGYYAVALAGRGAESVVGIDPLAERVEVAKALPHPANVRYEVAGAERLPFDDASFDAALLNEVLEHVADETESLQEIRRVLRPGGSLALFSPNRWFPFEGHGARLPSGRALVSVPVPLMPWLPGRLTRQFATARNYWPGELRAIVEGVGFEIVACDRALAQFDRYRWMPRRVIDTYRRRIPTIERSPLGRFAAVSTFIVARKPA
jgi:SAM-dependent methyltransferase